MFSYSSGRWICFGFFKLQNPTVNQVPSPDQPFAGFFLATIHLNLCYWLKILANSFLPLRRSRLLLYEFSFLRLMTLNHIHVCHC